MRYSLSSCLARATWCWSTRWREERGERFLPCCYGYATTIRRAQGASLDMGCLWFDQHYRHAGRGYGYVGVSRFKSQAGCYLFGKLRRTDFLPVGAEKEDEVTN